MERKSKYSEAYREKMPQVESIFMKKITQVHSSMSFNRVEPRINSSLDEFVRVFV